MAIIKSISGIRGTIGGKPGLNLTPPDIIRFCAAYASIIKEKSDKPAVVIGRDGRISGEMLQGLVVGTLLSMGVDVISLGLSTTPTVEMEVVRKEAQGGIILTASHNPKEWNALKLLNEKGEFISGELGKELITRADDWVFEYVPVNKLGTLSVVEDALEDHIEKILALPLVNVEAIKEKKFKIAVDGINSTGATSVPALLKALGVDQVKVINEEVNGQFAHMPEPLPENLRGLMELVKTERFDLGIAVDPDVDRLAFVQDDGEYFGEEYTLVSIAKYVLSKTPGATVSNLSSTRALKEITEKVDCSYFASAVGEVNVVEKMKEVDAVIGGEGNGGVIYPALHYGRDALVGIALFLSQLAETKDISSILRKKLPSYHIKKGKIQLPEGIDLDHVLDGLKAKYSKQEMDETDGLKLYFDQDWVHMRKSNTEPIIRIYTESDSETTAQTLTEKIQKDVGDFLKA
ncbi:phosphoglucosamine mutase [Chitinophagales bacterium]|nr:phosphoglucosamine mutase [Chitinophagales bacterium]